MFVFGDSVGGTFDKASLTEFCLHTGHTADRDCDWVMIVTGVKLQHKPTWQVSIERETVYNIVTM